MFISIQDLELRELAFREEFRPGLIDLGPDLEQQVPLKAAGRAVLLEEQHGGRGRIQDIRLVGEYSTRIQTRCARCLEAVEHKLASEFDLLFRPQGVDYRADEVSISEAETEIGYYRGEGLQLEDVLKEQLLLAVPVKTLCREDCKGLCPTCGCNWNTEPCACAPPIADVRWAALEDFKKKLES